MSSFAIDRRASRPHLRAMPPITLALIVANVAVFLLQGIAPGIVVPFALWPLAASASGIGASFGPWQVLTYAFLHGSLVHLAFNMFALYMFGGAIEQVFGPRRYLIYYFVCVVSAAVSQLVVAALMGGVYPTVGASGGIFGLLLAYAIYFPHSRVMLLFPPIPMPARVFVLVYAVIELYLGVTGSQAGVAHFAHLGGMIGGFIMLRLWRSSGSIRRGGPRF
jgi:membrane associated rhomboid family serine protease